MRSTPVILVLLLALSTHADERLFYQPHNSDATLSESEWQALWRSTVDHGVDTLIVQWTRHGDDDFGGRNGWLAAALHAAQREGLELILGLRYDPEYYRILPDDRRFASYWYLQSSHALEQHEALGAWGLEVAGWYMPLELDDYLFENPATRAELETQLQSLASYLDRPLHISAFSGGILSPEVFASWMGELTDAGIQVWWQDGHGTQALPLPVRQAYAEALDCRIGIVREAFVQVSEPDAPFQAQPNHPAEAPACHPSAVFSLRYRPWASILLDSEPDAMTAPLE
ncbi:DUF4434 domain-containing protein [Billgrantia aerodenitrificans]|uniref:DUF4434 domain-containing protein n=1 Tax=Billgrantia aerodenitrificans TaxID=2733483 RepID=A0ABS9ATR9_9GAMM|nr:DUF4434 domain-containing protein [Halomonas aerodenitrificans]MCE8025012.1 DUF4434 domain-containing protein [Halomonas aerodenitrificans]